MIPPIPRQQFTAEELALLKRFRAMNSDNKLSLQRFADFLYQDQSQTATDASDLTEVKEPLMITPKDNESVIAAIKRLGRQYPMVDKDTMLHETSDLMTQHIIQGKVKEAVITDLELLFKSRYQEYVNSFNA